MMSPPVRPRLRHVIWPGNLPDSRKIEVLKASEVFRSCEKTSGTFSTLDGLSAGANPMTWQWGWPPTADEGGRRQLPRHAGGQTDRDG
jgi:hypothetical protein